MGLQINTTETETMSTEERAVAYYTDGQNLA